MLAIGGGGVQWGQLGVYCLSALNLPSFIALFVIQLIVPGQQAQCQPLPGQEGRCRRKGILLLFLLAPVALDGQAEQAGEAAPPRQPSCRFLGTASGYLAGFPHGHLSGAPLGPLPHTPPQGDFQEFHGCHTQLSDELSSIPCILQQFPWESN